MGKRDTFFSYTFQFSMIDRMHLHIADEYYPMKGKMKDEKEGIAKSPWENER